MKCLSLVQFQVLDPGAEPLEPFGKGSNALKAETRDAGPKKPYRLITEASRPSVKLPTRIDGARGL
jgi:hypothetical protein